MATIKRRKPDAERKERAITIWVTLEQGKILDAMAEATGIPIATWGRPILVKAAQAVIERDTPDKKRGK
jgi:hypothetical protein